MRYKSHQTIKFYQMIVATPAASNSPAGGINDSLKGPRLTHLNIRSLRNTHLVNRNKIDNLTIPETWPNTTATKKKLEIEGFKLHRLDTLHKKAGGLCAYVRKT